MECILFKEENTTYVLPMMAVAHVLRLEKPCTHLPWQNCTIPIVPIDAKNKKEIHYDKPKAAVINALFETPHVCPYFAIVLGDSFSVLDIHEHEIAWAKGSDAVLISCEYRAPFEAKLINLMQLSKKIESEITH